MITSIIWFVCVAVVISAVFWFINRKSYGAFQMAGTALGISIFIGIAGVIAATAGAASDVEIINGKITSKTRDHGSYVRSYNCMCFTDSKGQKSCQTCYENRYTVKWWAGSTVGNFTIKSLDDNTRRVYLTPDPEAYTRIQLGEPASARNRYQNYIQAVPNSLFTAVSRDVKERFAASIPPYPDAIYNQWKNDHVVSRDVNVKDLAEWNARVANALREVGPAKQVNLIFLVTKIGDPNFEHAVRDVWENGNKNDVIVVIGAPNYPEIEFARIITWSKNELFKVELRDTILEHGKADQILTDIAVNQINKNFERREMKEFEYLKGEISLPKWVLALILTLMLGAHAGIYFYFRR